MMLKTTQAVKNRAKALTAQMTVEEKLNIIVETSEAIERLNIPKYYHGNEALHGVVRPGEFTVFPQAIALGAMFDDGFLEKIADAISTESRARYHNGAKGMSEDEFNDRYNGLLTFWSPDLNLARDPRWGRTAETYGEDPFLAGKSGAAFIRGLQGKDEKYLKAVATPKHFTANNEEHNRFECNAKMSEKTLREYHLEPFRIAVQEGHNEAVMAAYNAVNGLPCHENHRLLTEILRDEWGFDGYAVSDCSAVARLWDYHKRYESPADAASAALNAGVDLECGGYSDYEHMYKTFLGEQLKNGKITRERLDEAVTRVLTARIKLGQIDDESELPWAKLPLEIIGCEEHQKMAYEAAVRSMVLLKNNGILPLKNKTSKIAVVGNNAAVCQFGDYSGWPKNKPVTPLEGISAQAENITHVPWRHIEASSEFRSIPKEFISSNGEPGAQGSYYDNAGFAGLPKKRIDKNIDFVWEAQMPDPIITTLEYSVLWRGEITAPFSGEYRFDVSFSGSKKCCEPELFIDGGKTDGNTAVLMEKDEKIIFMLRYIKNTDAPSVKLQWIVPQNIADSELFLQEKEAAKAADAVIAVVGLGTEYEREGRDKTDLSLPPEQLLMLKKIKEVNDNLIVLLENGSALSIPWIDENAAAILECWYPGEQGGSAIADILFGKVSPSGRLPLSFPKRTEDLPPFDDYEMTNGRTYMYSKIPPLYPFGFGLSYTSFAYYDIAVTQNQAAVTVTNTGGCEADEVVQLYIDSAGLGNQPKFRLKGFKRIHLKPGERERISFPLNAESFSLFNETGERTVIPGKYSVYIDGHLPDENTCCYSCQKQ